MALGLNEVVLCSSSGLWYAKRSGPAARRHTYISRSRRCPKEAMLQTSSSARRLTLDKLNAAAYSKGIPLLQDARMRRSTC